MHTQTLYVMWNEQRMTGVKDYLQSHHYHHFHQIPHCCHHQILHFLFVPVVFEIKQQTNYHDPYDKNLIHHVFYEHSLNS